MFNYPTGAQNNYPKDYAALSNLIEKEKIKNTPNPTYKIGVNKKRHMWYHGPPTVSKTKKIQE